MLWVLMTTYNRREQTVECFKSLLGAYRGSMVIVDVDAGSIDGTGIYLRKCMEHAKKSRRYGNRDISLKILHCKKNVYWNQGMRYAMSYAAKHAKPGDDILLINDDVVFYEDAIDTLMKRRKRYRAAAVVGAVCSECGEQTYGGVRTLSKFFAKFEVIPPANKPVICDTFNCNCLLMSVECMRQNGNLDRNYIHSMGDYDYGLRMKRKGLKVISSAGYVGTCEANPIEESWQDTELPIFERVMKKETPKGLPAKDWFYFVKKNYGVLSAIYHSVTPYVRIVLGI